MSLKHVTAIIATTDMSLMGVLHVAEACDSSHCNNGHGPMYEGLMRGFTRADAPSPGGALASAGLAGNLRGSLVQ